MAIESQRPHVLDLSRPGGRVAVEIEVSEAAELLMSMCALSDEAQLETFDLGRARMEEIRRSASAGLLAAVDELLVGSEKIPAHLLGLVYETPRPRTIDAFLETLRQTSAVDIRLHLLDYYNASGHHLTEPETLRAAATGDAAAREQLLDAVSEWGSKRLVVERLLERPPDDLKAQLLDILPRWRDEIFRPLAEQAMSLAERDARAKRELARTLTPEDLVERATNGLRYTPAPHIRTIAMFPSFCERPWVILIEYKHVKILGYPISVDRDERGGADPAQLARVYKALADEGRLRLLKRLEEGPLTLTAAADELGLAKSTAHHHLAILRHAGFVVIRDADEHEYSLRRDVLPQAGELLSTYLRS
jgi:DNA-binding transcriptional ArsR family regulator